VSRRQTLFAFKGEFTGRNHTPDDLNVVGIKAARDRYTAGQCHQGGGTQVSMETPEQRAERFRERAKNLRALAKRTTDPEIKKQMLSMADQYEALAARDLDP
jgi:hypothetical protein